MYPRTASSQLTSFLEAQSVFEPKPIVVSSDIFVSELLAILRRIETSNCLLNIRSRDNAIGNSPKPHQLEKSFSSPLPEAEALEISPISVVVIRDFDLIGVLTEQDFVKLSKTDQAFEKTQLLDVIQPSIASISNRSTRQLLKAFTLFQQYWVRRLPVVNRQGNVIGIISPKTMRAMVEIHLQKQYPITESSQEIVSTHDSLQLGKSTQSELSAPQSLENSSSLILNREPLNSQFSALRSLEEQLARKTAECQYINRQLQLQIDENLELKQQLSHYQKVEQTTADIAQELSSPLSLKTFLERTVKHIQELFQFDRVCIYHYESNWSGLVISEAVKSGFSSILNFLLRHELISSEHWLNKYQQGEVCSVENIIPQAGDFENSLDAETLALMEFFQVKSLLIVPIRANHTLWGLLVIHQCTESHPWQSFEISLLQSIASSLKAAIERSGLSEKIQQLHEELHLQEKTHIHRLQQALDYDAMLNRVTDRVRDSLDEEHILQTAIQELVTVLGIRCCQVVLCSLPPHIVCELAQHYSTDPIISSDEGQMITEYWELGQQIQKGQCSQFCLTDPLLNQGKNAILICPVFDDQGYLGDLRLYARRSYVFDNDEIRLVQQIASHCAIAIRQARLYQASQAQVQELEHLHQLKDDFLSTVSHELRTPLASIRMVTNLLKMTFQQSYQTSEEPAPNAIGAKITHYLKVLEEECDREINLVDDLLATQNLNTGSHPLSLSTIHLQDWVKPIVESFQHRARMQQHQFELVVANNLPTVVCDSFMLSRILVELLNNAFKYTPVGEAVLLELTLSDPFFRIKVKNTGIEIAPEALPRIFDPFYRIPKDDRWKTGGTGLGLSLIKRLVEYLGGKIWVESANRTVQFLVELPFNPPLTGSSDEVER